MHKAGMNILFHKDRNLSNNHIIQNNSVEPQLTHKSILKLTLNLIFKHRLHKFLFGILLMLIIIGTTSSMIIPVFIKNIIDNLSHTTNLSAYLKPMLLLLVLGTLAGFFQAILSTLLTQKIVLELRQRVVTHSLKQSMSYYTKEPIGRMVTRITKDLDETSNFFDMLFSQIIGSGMSLFIVCAILINLNFYLFLYTLLAVPLIVVFAEFYRRKVYIKSKLVREQTSRVNVYLAEHLQATTDLQVNNKLNESINNFYKYNEDLYHKERKLGINQTLVHPILSLIQTIIVVIICLSGIALTSKALVTVGTFIAYIQLIERIFWPLMSLAQASTQIQTCFVSLDRLFSFLHINTALPEVSTHKNTDFETGSDKERSLKFKDVNFSYNPQTQVLFDIDFALEEDEKIALVGHSGSGKSTISKLCMRFWDIDEGSIELNGINIKDYPLHVLREKVVLLEQDSFIFKDTIRENICIGREIAQDILDRIAEKTGLDKLVKSYSDGWNHILDSKSISTGEQRLIAIARVLVAPPDFIILDEFSATLDSATELKIQSLLEELETNRGVIIIAHRLHTIMQCDKILFIEQGHIVERGTHQELIALNGHYTQLISHMMDKKDV